MATVLLFAACGVAPATELAAENDGESLTTVARDACVEWDGRSLGYCFMSLGYVLRDGRCEDISGCAADGKPGLYDTLADCEKCTGQR